MTNDSHGVNAFYTCFISFTEADEVFSRHLYNDLRAAGVRCWRWKEDAIPGGVLRREIDGAIALYDKLVVILSKDSLRSKPVIREIKRALQKEQREGREVLFPIRLDDEIFSWKHTLRSKVVSRVIGDCRKRRNGRYKEALSRLIIALRKEWPTKYIHVDSSPLLGRAAGVIWDEPYDPSMKVSIFLNRLWAAMRPDVGAYTYGVKWVLRDGASQRIFKELVGEISEPPEKQRSLSEIGMRPNDFLEVVRFRS